MHEQCSRRVRGNVALLWKHSETLWKESADTREVAVRRGRVWPSGDIHRTPSAACQVQPCQAFWCDPSTCRPQRAVLSGGGRVRPSGRASQGLRLQRARCPCWLWDVDRVDLEEFSLDKGPPLSGRLLSRDDPLHMKALESSVMVRGTVFCSLNILLYFFDFAKAKPSFCTRTEITDCNLRLRRRF